MSEFESRVEASVSETLHAQPWYRPPHNHIRGYVDLLVQADGSSLIDPWLRQHARKLLFSRNYITYLFIDCAAPKADQ